MPPPNRWPLPPPSVSLHTGLLCCAIIIAFVSAPETSFPALGFRIGDSRWRIPAALLVHIDAWHLANNLAIQGPVGMAFEVINGHAAAAAVFWCGGVVGLAFQTIAMSDGTVLGGASPGCLATASAFLGSVLFNWSQTPPLLRYAIAAQSVFTIIVTLVSALHDPMPGVAHVSHIAGAAQGVIVGAAVVPNWVVSRWERWVRTASRLVAVASLATALAVL